MIDRRSLVPALTGAALAASALALGQAVGTVIPAPPELMSVADVRPGMRGYGLSVFHGTQPERFDVEVVDVLHGARPRMDLVLVRPSHPVLEHAATVAGMSGSPIYIEGRLLGAYAYGWEFSRDPVAGVTPIGHMLAEGRRQRRTPPGLIPGPQVPLPIGDPEDAPEAPARRGRRLRSSWEQARERMLARRVPVPSPYGALETLAVPLAVSGLGERAVQALAESLAPLGMIPTQAGGGGRSGNTTDPVPAHFEPGGSVSVVLVSGDVSAMSTGTVTDVRDGLVFGYGHPMLSLGEVALQTARSRVVWVNPNLRRSLKMAEPLADLGAMVQDRPAAIVVDEAARAPTVPMRVRFVGGTDPGQPQEWNVRIAYHRALFSRLATMVLSGAIENTQADNGDTGWTLRSRIVTRDHGTLTLTEHGTSPEGIGPLALPTLRVGDALDRLTDNVFQQVRIDRVDVDLEIHWLREFWWIRSVAASRSEVDPGQTVQLRVVLGRYGGPDEVRTVDVALPRECAGRETEIEVAPGSETVADLPEPDSVDDLIRALGSNVPDDAMVVSVRLPGQGVTLRGRVLHAVPGSATDALRPAVNTDAADPFPLYQRTIVPAGRIVLGRDRVRVRVRDIRQ